MTIESCVFSVVSFMNKAHVLKAYIVLSFIATKCNMEFMICYMINVEDLSKATLLTLKHIPVKYTLYVFCTWFPFEPIKLPRIPIPFYVSDNNYIRAPILQSGWEDRAVEQRGV